MDTNITEKERGKHWISMKVDLIIAELVVFYCNWKFYKKVKLDRFYGTHAKDDFVREKEHSKEQQVKTN